MKNSRTFLLVCVLGAGLLMLWRFWDVVMLFLGAGLIAYLLGPLVNLLCRRVRMPRWLAVVIVLLAVLAVFAVLLSVSIPYIVSQIGALVGDIQLYPDSLDEIGDRLYHWVGRFGLPSFLMERVAEELSKLDSYLLRLFTAILEWLVNFSAGLTDMIVMVIATVYILLDGRRLLRTLLDRLPLALADRCRRVLHESDRMFWRYLRSRVILSGGMMIVTYIGLKIIGIRFAALFAFMSFVLDFIPYFGSTAAAVIEAVYALITGGLAPAITVTIFVLVVQQIEGNVVGPKMQADAIGIHPIAILFSLLACSKLWGPVGMLISPPVAGLCKVVITEAYQLLTDGMDTPERVAARKAAEAAQPVPAAAPPPEDTDPPEAR